MADDNTTGGFGGLLSGAANFFAPGNSTDIDPTTGLTEAQRKQAMWGTFGNLGALLMAAGQKQMPAQRAQYLAQLGNIPDQMQKQQLSQIQQNLLGQKMRQQQQMRDVISNDSSLTDTQKTLLMNSPEAAAAWAKGQFAPEKSEATADVKNYNYYVNQAKASGQQPMNFQDWFNNVKRAGATNVTVGGGKLDEKIGGDLLDKMNEAEAARGTINALHNARRQLDEGIVSGIQADPELALRKIGTMFGINDPKVTGTEAFRAAMKPIVLETVKGLGSGSAISNADREFALEAVGGNIKLDESSMRRILDITERAAREKIGYHNKKIDTLIEDDPELKKRRRYLQIEAPGEYVAPKPPAPAGGATPQQPAARKTMRIDLDGNVIND